MHVDAMVALLTTTENRLHRSWIAMVAHLRDENSVEAIAQRIAAGHPEPVAVASIVSAATRYAAAEHAAYIHAGQVTARWLDGQVDKAQAAIAKKFTVFDAGDPPAVAWAKTNQLDLIREITTEQRDAIRQILVAGAKSGVNPRVMAQEIRDSIGLTEYQTQIVENYRRELEAGQYAAALARELSHGQSDRVIATAVRNSSSLTQAQIDTAVERYRANWQAYRAENITRDEGLRVAHQGSEELYRQAVERGDIEPAQIRRTWNHSPGAKNKTYERLFHKSMAGQVRGYGESFVSGLGGLLRYPGDPQASAKETSRCRCVVTTRILPRRAGAAAPQATVAAPPVRPSAPATAAPPPRLPPPPPSPLGVPVVVEPPAVPVRAPVPPRATPSVPIAEPIRDAATLADVRIVAQEQIPGRQSGANVSYRVTLDDGTQAIFKPSSGENEFAGRTNIPPGGMAVREAAAFRVSEALGVGGMVPETAAVEHAGEAGSLQRWAVGARPLHQVAETTLFDRGDAERMRVFDFIIGNSDRHNGNVLFEARGDTMHPVLIDHALSFPNGLADQFIQPIAHVPSVRGPLLASTLDQIYAVDLELVAKTLADSGLENEAIRHTLYRARALQLDPEMLEIPWDSPSESVWNNASRLAYRMIKGPELERINAIVDKYAAP